MEATEQKNAEEQEKLEKLEVAVAASEQVGMTEKQHGKTQERHARGGSSGGWRREERGILQG